MSLFVCWLGGGGGGWVRRAFILGSQHWFTHANNECTKPAREQAMKRKVVNCELLINHFDESLIACEGKKRIGGSVNGMVIEPATI